MKPNILIGTPTTEEKNSVVLTKSLWRLQRHFFGHAEMDLLFTPEKGLPLSRNILANVAYRDTARTHLALIDSDMGFEPTLFEKMLAIDKPMVGVAAPFRRPRPEHTGGWNAVTTPPDSPSLGFIFYPLDDDPMSGPVPDFKRAKMAGTGILLIRRDALDRFVAQFPERWTKDTDPLYRMPGRVFQFFWPAFDENDAALPEDMAFTLQWTKVCGGELWVCMKENITHTGPVNFVGNWASAEQARKEREGLTAPEFTLGKVATGRS